MGSWVGPGVSLDMVVKRKNTCPGQESNPGHSPCSLVPTLTELSWFLLINNKLRFYYVYFHSKNMGRSYTNKMKNVPKYMIQWFMGKQTIGKCYTLKLIYPQSYHINIKTFKKAVTIIFIIIIVTYTNYPVLFTQSHCFDSKIHVVMTQYPSAINLYIWSEASQWLNLIKSSWTISHVKQLKETEVSGIISVPIIRNLMWLYTSNIPCRGIHWPHHETSNRDLNAPQKF